MKKNRVFSLKFRADAVQWMQAGESPSALSRTLKVRRKLLYEWRDRVLAGRETGDIDQLPSYRRRECGDDLNRAIGFHDPLMVAEHHVQLFRHPPMPVFQ